MKKSSLVIYGFYCTACPHRGLIPTGYTVPVHCPVCGGYVNRIII